MEFKPFPKINSLRNTRMQITQKIHGTNAQVMIIPIGPDEFAFRVANKEVGLIQIEDNYFEVRAGSRTRWIYPGADNYGFAQFVHDNSESLVRSLGEGQHFGEWAGPGINSGEGLSSKVFFLFDYYRYPADKPLPPHCARVPVLYEGAFDLLKIDECMNDLKTNGSRACPGFMRPEGVVVNVLGNKMKRVFDAEETQWKSGDPAYRAAKDKEADKSYETVAHLLQPIRLEKLLSRDENFVIGFPRTMPAICSTYVQDLIDEGQIAGDESQVEATKKVLGKHIFGFLKQFMKEKGL